MVHLKSHVSAKKVMAIQWDIGDSTLFAEIMCQTQFSEHFHRSCIGQIHLGPPEPETQLQTGAIDRYKVAHLVVVALRSRMTDLIP